MLFPEAFLGSWKGKDKSGPGCDARCWPFLRQLRPQREARVSQAPQSPLELEPGPGACPLLAPRAQA